MPEEQTSNESASIDQITERLTPFLNRRNTMSDPTPPEDDLTEEFRNLGKNLADALRTAWEHPERKRLQEEITDGLNEMGSALKQEAEAFSESPTGQQLKSDVQRISENIRSPESQARVRQELISVLQAANAELQKVIQQLTAAYSQPSSAETPGETIDETPDVPPKQDPEQEA